jgi:hypothetical protein
MPFMDIKKYQNDFYKSLNDLGVFGILIVDLGTPKLLLFLSNLISLVVMGIINLFM